MTDENSMPGAQHARVRAVFLRVCDLEGAARAAALANECQDEAELRRRVEQLLDHDKPVHDAFDLPEASHAHSSPSWQSNGPLTREFEDIPEFIGPYRIVRELGRGGMGLVFLAEQADPQRTVALKLLRPALLFGHTRRRFEREIEILASLRHPAIAPVFATGEVETSVGVLPWFAMQLIEGLPITHYACEQSLDTGGCIQLVKIVAEAVHYCHEHAIVHRDLKPTNVLVDSSGRPHVLDFGVARPCREAQPGETLLTETGELVGTLPYMSPEQARGETARIDARTDVYALGAILYELLAGASPVETHGLPLHEATRNICDVRPRRLGAIDRALTGDLETIVAKALEKDPGRRYPTAEAFAADLERFLGQQPIAARPPSAVYRMRKFALRNRALSLSLGATLVTLVLALIGTSWGLVREAGARQEAERAARLADLRSKLLNSAVRALAPDEPEPTGGSAFLTAVDSALNQALQGLSPYDEFQLRRDAATIFEGLFAYDAALREIDRCLAILPSKGFLDQRSELLVTRVTVVSELPNRQHEAVQTSREVLTSIESWYGANSAEFAHALHASGYAMMMIERYAKSEELTRRALDIRERVLGRQTPDYLWSLNLILNIRLARGDLPMAETIAREALDLRRELFRNQPRLIATGESQLARILCDRGRVAEAIDLLRRAIRGFEGDTFNADGTRMSTQCFLANALVRAGQPAEAEALMRETLEALAGTRVTRSDGHRRTRNLARIRLGQALLATGRPTEALGELSAGLAGLRRDYMPGDRRVLEARFALAELHEVRGEIEVARDQLESAVRDAECFLESEHWLIAESHRRLGELLARRWQVDCARTALAIALPTLTRVFGPDDERTASCRQHLFTMMRSGGHELRPDRPPTEGW